MTISMTYERFLINNLSTIILVFALHSVSNCHRVYKEIHNYIFSNILVV